jgi:hypothetical protein
MTTTHKVGLQEVVSALGIDPGRITGKQEVILRQELPTTSSESQDATWRITPLMTKRLGQCSSI